MSNMNWRGLVHRFALRSCYCNIFLRFYLHRRIIDHNTRFLLFQENSLYSPYFVLMIFFLPTVYYIGSIRQMGKTETKT